ncbi:putative BNR repeat neuraminidase [Kordia periserrulae]|uniref:Putative BNR repeat neuraminidase n=2 Tax=Kordia periserrulae TaxID=701523 RepID=A0A2T6C3S7_9FLAO|nr:putative BNR repeat neuraminidase [Kordia periserrulae]
MLGANGLAQQPTNHVFVSSEATSSENYTSMTFNGVWCWFSDPRAVYFEGKHKRTYAGWIDNYGDVHIGYYDHETQVIDSKVIYDNLEIDDHDNPSIVIDDDGRLLVFFNTHLQDERPLFFCKSLQPESIQEWSPVEELFLNDEEKYRTARILRHTYTNPVRLSNEKAMYLFWRGVDVKPSFSVSKNNGESWSAGEVLFQPKEEYDLKVPYTKVYSDGISKIHFTFTDGHPAKETNNKLYYMYYENGAFFKANGQKIKEVSQLPVLASELDVIFESDSIKSWNWDIAQNKNGNPVVTYVKFPQKDKHIYAYATFENNQWKSYDIIEAGGWFPKTRENTVEPSPHYSGGIVIDHEMPNTVYLSVKRNGVFEIEQWTTQNRGKSWKVQKITENSTKDNIRPFAVRGAKPGNPLQLLWLQSTNYIYFAHDTRGKTKEVDFKERFHTAVKMNLKKPSLTTSLTKENLLQFLRQVAERLLENPNHSLSKQRWNFGMWYAGIEAFYEITKEDRYTNELQNIQQYFGDTLEDVDEESTTIFDVIWSFNAKNNRKTLQQLESLQLADFEEQEASLSFASQIRAIEQFENEIASIEALKASITKEKDAFLELLNPKHIGDTLQIRALIIYSVAAGIRNGIFDKKYIDTVKSSLKQLQSELLKNQLFKKLDTETSAAVLLAGKEIYLLLNE